MSNKGASILLTVFVVGMLLSGCGLFESEPEKKDYRSRCSEANPSVAGPRIIVGEQMPDVSGYYTVAKGDSWVINPSQIYDTLNVVIEGVEYIVAIDKNNMVKSVFTHDSKFRNRYGFGVGTTYAEIKSKYKNHYIAPQQYMSIVWVDTDNGLTWVFPMDESKGNYNAKINDSEKVISVNFECIPPSILE